jgi:hypothetical protein
MPCSGGHLEFPTEDYPIKIPAMFAFKWLSGFKE